MEQREWGGCEESTCSCIVGVSSILGVGSMVTVPLAPPAAIVLPALFQKAKSWASPFQGGSSRGGAEPRASHPWSVARVTGPWPL